MKNKIKVVTQFFFETVITLLPFTIIYLLLGNWLSGVTISVDIMKNDGTP
ncbi:hypothetical protein H9636_14550 [Ureibacillus sp. Re31]|uniref:Uncharacterized protein n=1 Tax=Ureibacillus galli TaxID=2762222 RepID=A0ABR8XF86_9BACL|nr:hypothetical protein [Ureibacillus galli]MBD8027870.1 hypothetical protein [Ureibacillus galli]